MMKQLNIEQLENFEGRGDISDTISGVCSAIGVAGALRLIAISRTAAAGIGIACAVNAAGGYFDWW